MIYLTAIGLTPGGSSTVHIYTQTIHEQHNGHKTIHRTTQLRKSASYTNPPYVFRLFPKTASTVWSSSWRGSMFSVRYEINFQPCKDKGGWLPASHLEGPVSIPGQSTFFLQVLLISFVSIFFQQCSIHASSTDTIILALLNVVKYHSLFKMEINSIHYVD